MNDILEYRNVVKRYGYQPVLDGLTLTVPRGKIVGLLGPNGSGKTTMIKLAAGLLHAQSGEVLINGKQPGAETKAVVSYLPERTYFAPSMTPTEMMDCFSDFYLDFDRERAQQMISDLKINPAQRFKTMSKGTKEKIQLIMVMARRAQLYLLDEPIAGVDPAARDYILRTILTAYHADATILISTHLISDIEPILDEFIFLRDGQLLMQSTREAVKEERSMTVDNLFREVYRC